MESRCDVCGLRKRAEIRPNPLIARLWGWHTTWRPGWKVSWAELATQQVEAGAEPSITA